MATDNQLEPIDGKDCAKVCSSTGCDYTWRSSDCSESLPYICEAVLRCPDGWASYENSCYKLEQSTTRSQTYTAADCLSNHDAYPVVPNTNEEAAYIANFVKGKAETETFKQLGLSGVLVGTKQYVTRQYAENMDGTFMTNGSFHGIQDQWFTDAYHPYYHASCTGLNSDGAIFKCGEVHVMCEKNTLADNIACVSGTNLDSAISVNASTKLAIWRQTPQKCIEYCRGYGNEYGNNSDLHAVVYYDECACAQGPLDESKEEPLGKCILSPWSYALEGTADDSYVAIYDAGYDNKVRII